MLELYILNKERQTLWRQLRSLNIDMKDNEEDIAKYIDMEDNHENVPNMKHDISLIGALLQANEFKHMSNGLFMANLKLRIQKYMSDLHPPHTVSITKWYEKCFMPPMRRYEARFTKVYYTRCEVQAFWETIWPAAEGGIPLEDRFPVDSSYCIKPDDFLDQNNETAQSKQEVSKEVGDLKFQSKHSRLDMDQHTHERNAKCPRLEMQAPAETKLQEADESILDSSRNTANQRKDVGTNCSRGAMLAATTPLSR